MLLARDTRPHSERLLARVAAGVAAVAGDSGAVSVGDCGLLTTPQLHHIVRARNLEAAGISLPGVPAEPRLGSVEGYHAELARAYAALLTATAPEAGLPPSAAAAVAAQAVSRGPLHVDCANGVGGRHSRLLAAAMGSAGSAAAGSAAGSAPHLLDMVVHNAGDTAEEAALLNEGVGAEHCQKGRAPPATGFEPASDYAGVRCASLDGDADRVVFWYYSKADAAGAGAGAPVVWHLLDGDKIAALAAAFIADQLADLGMPLTPHPTHAPHGEADDSHAHAAPSAASAAAAPVDPAAPVSVGVVQTAYANGASSDYIRGTLRLPVALAKTGVKFVHAAAAAFDVGVYFEANGHGTVLFHESFLARLLALDVASLSPKQVSQSASGIISPTCRVHACAGDFAIFNPLCACDHCAPLPLPRLLASLPLLPVQAAARARLLAASRLINQAIGDALSDAMFVEAVLALKGWSVSQWDAIYSDLPSAQAKMAVPDRSAVRVSEDETRVLHPAALQDAIDAAVAAVPRGRAFVRPSGTEDCVRFYAEAADEASAKALLAAVQDATRRILIS